MPKSRSSIPVVTVGENSTVVELGTLRVTVNRIREPSRADRFRLNWWLDGRRKTRNRETHDDAVELAKEVLAELSKGREPLTHIEERKLGYYQTCEQQLSKVPLDVAVKYYLQHNSDLLVPLTAHAIVEELIAAKEARQGVRKASKRWIETLRSGYREFAKAFPQPIHEIESGEIAAYLNRVTWSLRTRFNHQRSIGHIFRLGRAKRALPAGESAFDQHMKSAHAYEKPVEDEKQPLSPAELRRLFKAAVAIRPKFVPFLAICAFAPVRVEEACRLCWGEHVDLADGVIRLTQNITKTSRRRIIPINDTLRAWLAGCEAKVGRVQPYSNQSRIKQELVEHAELAAWPHNALRVSVISYMMVLNPDAAALAEAAGHSESMLQTVYKQIRGVSIKRAEEWFDTLPNTLDKPAGSESKSQEKAAERAAA